MAQFASPAPPPDSLTHSPCARQGMQDDPALLGLLGAPTLPGFMEVLPVSLS